MVSTTFLDPAIQVDAAVHGAELVASQPNTIHSNNILESSTRRAWRWTTFMEELLK